MFGNRIPTPPLGEWQTKNKTKQIVMPAKPKISKDQLFCQMMMVRYGGIINIYDNSQPFAKPEVKKKKWWQIWK